MIGYLSGAVASSSAKSVIIDCNGVGYLVYVGEKMQSMIPQVGAPIKLYTHFSMSPRDGEVALFGFATPEELSFFVPCHFLDVKEHDVLLFPVEFPVGEPVNRLINEPVLVLNGFDGHGKPLC